MCALNNNLYERLAIEDADNFLRQSVFECANEDCDSHKKYEKTGFNADFNAARNIAMSTLWMENGQVTEKSKQEAREYYGISEKYEQSKNDLENNKVAYLLDYKKINDLWFEIQ